MHKRHIKNIFLFISQKKKAFSLHRICRKSEVPFQVLSFSRSMPMNDSFALARNALQALTHDSRFVDGEQKKCSLMYNSIALVLCTIRSKKCQVSVCNKWIFFPSLDIWICFFIFPPLKLFYSCESFYSIKKCVKVNLKQFFITSFLKELLIAPTCIA